MLSQTIFENLPIAMAILALLKQFLGRFKSFVPNS